MIKTSESHESPKRFIQSHWKIRYNFNIQQSVNDDGDIYRYKYIELDPKKVTKAQIFKRLSEDSTLLIDDTAHPDLDVPIDTDAIDSEFATITKELDNIAQMTWSQVNKHIDSVFGNLNTAQKASLKKLYKAVVALSKLRG